MAEIAGRKRSVMSQSDTSDKGVAQVNWRSQGFAPSGQSCRFSSRRGIQKSNTALHQLDQQHLQTLLQPATPGSCRKNLQAVAQLKHHDAGQPDLIGRLLVKPANHPWIWSVLHHSRDHIGVEQDHALKLAGSAS